MWIWGSGIGQGTRHWMISLVVARRFRILVIECDSSILANRQSAPLLDLPPQAAFMLNIMGHISTPSFSSIARLLPRQY